MALVALTLQGKSCSPQGLVDRFERENHFATYLYETHTSVSTNANVLTALVTLSTDGHYQLQIEKCIRYLCDAWFHCDGMVTDKWNQDGSWGSSDSAEETAYAILILKSIACFSFTDLISARVKTAISRGLEYILTRSQRSLTDDQLWLDKTLYAMPTVSDSYILAAVQTEESVHKLADIPCRLVDMPMMTVYKMTEYFSALPSQTKTPKWLVQASVIESILLSGKLKTLDVFATGKSLGKKYVKFAACFWTLANNSSPEYFMSTQVIYSMIELSIGLFQEDDLMETSLANLPDDAMPMIADYIDGLRHGTSLCQDHSLRHHPNGQSTSDMDEETLTRVKNIHQNIDVWVRFVLDHNLTEKTSASDRRDLRQEVIMSMVAAMQQAKAQKLLSNAKGHCGTERLTVCPGQNFYTWLHTSAVHDVKSAVVSKSLICKIGNGGDVFTTAREKYLSEKLWRQMTVEGRLWNDLGSIERDRLASNLNSVNFPEFSSPQSLETDGNVRSQLLQLAEYEGGCTLSCLSDLAQLLENSGREMISRYLRMYHRCCVIYNETCVKYAFGSTTAT